MTSDTRDLARTVFMVLFILGLVAASLRIVQAFALATIWAATIVIATWPLMLRIQARLGGRRGAATAVMVGGMLVFLIVPLGLAVGSVVSNREAIAVWIAGLPEMSLPQSPSWVQEIPVVGARIAAAWNDVAVAGMKDLVTRLAPHTRDAFAWVLGRLGGLGVAMLQFLLTVVIAGILYTKGETAADGLRRFARRLGGDRGDKVVRLAGQSIRAVALGVVVTAIVQTALAGLGLLVAGIPFAALLTGVIFLLCIAQLGPTLVMIPATLWLYSTGSYGWGTALLVWSVFVGTIDNVIKPVLIKRGADLPLLLIFAGVLGGLFAYGVIGLFVGPVVLAVTYTLLKEWVASDPAAAVS